MFTVLKPSMTRSTYYFISISLCSAFKRGTKLKIRLSDLEMSSRFLGSVKDITLLEADATLVGLARNELLKDKPSVFESKITTSN